MQVLGQTISKLFAMYHGDSCEVIKGIPSNSVGFSVYSPPFASLYTYSNSERDMGNCKNDEEFFTHFQFLASEIYRILKPGRLMAVHCMQLPKTKERDGVIGLRDFRGDLIRLFEKCGFVYHSEVCVWKNPVTAMQRTKALGLLHKTIRNDSSRSRQGIADYVIVMRKPDQNVEPITHDFETFPISLWQRYASPVWMDINPSNTLQYRSAREGEDERHICPLQLDVIERCCMLWSNPGDVVFSPFGGIGSEGYQALKMGRRFIGIELKESYFKLASRNLQEIEAEVLAKKPDVYPNKYKIADGTTPPPKYKEECGEEYSRVEYIEPTEPIEDKAPTPALVDDLIDNLF